MPTPSFDPAAPPRVLVVGDLMIDRYFWGECERVSPEAPVQVVAVKRESVALGGAGNVVANIATLGARVEFVGIVGADAARDSALRLLEGHGVSDAGLVVDPTRVTTIKSRVVASHQQIVRFDVEVASDPSAAVEAAVLERVARFLPTSSVVVLSDYAKGVLSPRVTQEIIARCRNAKVPVLVDPKGRDYSKYRGASLITPNRKEAALASGVALDDAHAVASAGEQLMATLGLDACLITLGEGGMMLLHAGGRSHLATQAREVFDVTGAGDTVIAAVAFGLATRMSLLDACHFANRAAGIVVGKLGSATVTLDEIRASAGGDATAIRKKVTTLADAIARVAALRSTGKRIVFTNGCFDLLHAGHVSYLASAATLGDVLIVGLNSDESVQRLKGAGRPIHPLDDRALVLAGLASVSLVVAFEAETPRALIEALVPDVLVKGGDYRPDDIVGADVVKAAGGRVLVLPFLEGRSTTSVIARVAKGTS